MSPMKRSGYQAAGVAGLLIWIAGCGDGAKTADGQETEPPRDTATQNATDSDSALGDPGTIAVSIDHPIPVGEMAVSLNYWSWVDAWGNNVAGTEAQVAGLSPKLIRIGGHNNDVNDPEAFDSAELDEAIAYIKGVGAEPLLQVPALADEAGEEPTVETAATMVTYVNITNDYRVRYFSIGNEPDLYVEQGDKPAGYTAEEYCLTFRQFAEAMRAVDPDIRLVGPDLSWKYQSGSNDWLTPFLEGCGDIVDVVAVHRYPVDPTETHREQAFADAEGLRRVISGLRNKMDAVGMGDKPLGLTEVNITWDGEPATSTLDASPGTFYAGMWAADTLGVALEEGLWSYAFWSISEGWTLGMLDGVTPRPIYHMVKMYADHFGPTAVEVTEVPSGFSAYAGRSAGNDATVVMVLNKTATASEQTIRIQSATQEVGNVVQVFPPDSFSAVTLPDNGEPSIWSYVESDGETGPTKVL